MTDEVLSTQPLDIPLEKLTVGSHLIRKSRQIGTFQGIKTKNNREYLVVQFPDYDSFIPTEQYGKLCYPISEAEIKELLLSQPLSKSAEAKKIQSAIDYIRDHQTYSIANFKDYTIPPELREQLIKLLAASKRRDFIFTVNPDYPNKKNEDWVTVDLGHALSFLTPLNVLPIWEWDRNKRRALSFVNPRNPINILQYFDTDNLTAPRINLHNIPDIPAENIHASVLLTGLRNSATIMDIIFNSRTEID